MFSSFKRPSGIALALILLASPVYAADITPDVAAKLKTLIQTQIDMRKSIQAAAGGSYTTEGELKVEPVAGYYAVTFPHAKLKDATGKTFDLGAVSANVIHGDRPQDWKAAIALPTPIGITGSDGKPLGQIDIGKQKAVGLWDLDLGSFSRLDAQYDDVVFHSATTQGNFKISSLAFKTLLDREASGHLSGPGSAILSGWTIASPEDHLTAQIKQIRIDVSVKDFDPQVAKAFNQQIGTVGQTGQTVGSSPAAPQANADFYDMATTLIGKSADSFNAMTTVSDISITAPNKATKAMETFALGTAVLGFDMSGFRNGAVKTSVKLSYGGLKLNDPADPLRDIIPLSLNLDLALNNLPFAKLVELGRTAAAGKASGDPNALQAAGMTAMISIPKLLTEAKTALTHSFDFAGTIYKGKGSGVVHADSAAAAGYTAEQDVELTGVDRIIAKINDALKSPDPEAQSLQGALGTLTVLQMVGQKKPGDDDTRTYKLVVDAAGKTLLNGADLSTLMGAVTGGPAPGAPAATPALLAH